MKPSQILEEEKNFWKENVLLHCCRAVPASLREPLALTTLLWLFAAVVTTTTATTVVHTPYPQAQGVPASYPTAPYQGYQPVAIQPQPGMPVAPYPAQYPPPYPTQPPGPPAYHETVAGKNVLIAGCFSNVE